MSSDVEAGQVLSIIIRFNNGGTVSKSRHPYLVVGIDNDMNIIEVAQLDSLKGKEYKAVYKSNKTIYYDNPIEIVIDKDSYIQMDNTIKIENYADICRYRRQKDKLSQKKLYDVLISYQSYHTNNEINENKQIYINKNELEFLNT